MRNAFVALLKSGIETLRDVCPELPEAATGLPTITTVSCQASCQRCVQACPTSAISLLNDGELMLDRGRCIGCSACVQTCPTGTLTPDRSTRIATLTREALVLSNRNAPVVVPPSQRRSPFRRSLHVREVSTGSSGTDQEVQASTNSQFDVARFGIHFVASPRHADALLVTGPVGKAMQEALRRCYDAMAEPRLVIAVGTCAISGGLHAGGYAEANGVDTVLPVTTYVPGDPPHPWSIIHGLLLAMGRA
ncbi:MAG: NADH-quinone oxidoreductase subunit B family protein [Armatimonadota bacterium]